eukprot:CFRG0425T1
MRTCCYYALHSCLKMSWRSAWWWMFGGDSSRGSDEELGYNNNNINLFPIISNNEDGNKAGESIFGENFFMGGETFPALKPDAYLFGPLSDLVHLEQPVTRKEGESASAAEGSRTDVVKCGINLQRSSLRITRVQNPDQTSSVSSECTDDSVTTESVERANEYTSSARLSGKQNLELTTLSSNDTAEQDDGKLYEYWLRFRFDSVCRCRFTIHLGASEYLNDEKRLCRTSRIKSQSFEYEAGFNQEFSEEEFTIKPSLLPPSERKWLKESPSRYPMIVVMEAINDNGKVAETMSTSASFDENAEFKFSSSVLKQKLTSGGRTFMLQEIYGLEHHAINPSSTNSAEEKEKDCYIDSEYHECIVCLCDPRDTAVLPCRHLCLCHGCAEVLRYQSNKCPLCRAPFHSLACISVARKLKPGQEPKEEEEETEIDGQRYRLVPVSQAADKTEPPTKLTETVINDTCDTPEEAEIKERHSSLLSRKKLPDNLSIDKVPTICMEASSDGTSFGDDV